MESLATGHGHSCKNDHKPLAKFLSGKMPTTKLIDGVWNLQHTT